MAAIAIPVSTFRIQSPRTAPQQPPTAHDVLAAIYFERGMVTAYFDPVDLNTRPKEVEVANAVKYCHRVIAAYDAVNDQKPEVAVAAQNLEKAAPTLEKAAQTLEKAAQNLEKNFMTLINQALDDFKRDIIEEMKTSQEADINSSMDGLKAVIKQDMEEHFTKIGINLTEVKSDVKNLIHNIAVLSNRERGTDVVPLLETHERQ